MKRLLNLFPISLMQMVKQITVTLPANTEINDQDIYISVKDNLSSDDYTFIQYENIEKIILTF